VPRSLRSRLIASHLLVIGLAFLLTIVVAAIPVRRAQLRAEERRLESVAQSIAVQTDFITERSGSRLLEPALGAFLLRQSRVTNSRVLLASADGTIVYDPQPYSLLVDQRLPGLAERIERLRAEALRAAEMPGAGVVPLAVTESAGRVDDRLAAIATTTGSNDRSSTTLYPVVLSPARQLPVLDRLLRPLVAAALAAALAAVAASLWLARSISRPISDLTTTATSITAGNLDQRAPGEGEDEVGQLVRAFNAMIDRLATTYRSQRVMLANIAHELRTPLTSIQGYAQALRDDVLPDESGRELALEVVQQESDRISDLVNQILHLSRLESGQTTLSPEPVQLNQLLEQLKRSFDLRAQRAGVGLSLLADQELVEADEELLTQALGNLVGNAIRHTPAGGSVELRASRVTPAGGAPLVRITVSDTGQGIPAVDLPHIFERFYRASGSVTAGDAAGTADSSRRFGLGLAIAHEIVARHGGTIAVASEPGRGTVFTVDLPVAPGQRGPDTTDGE
jgi:signal transduction histidine kinase